MTTVDFITELFCWVDDRIANNKHRQGKLYPGEVVTLVLLYSLKGRGQRAFWRRLVRDYQPSSLNYHTEPVCFVCLTVTGLTLRYFWLTLQ